MTLESLDVPTFRLPSWFQPALGHLSQDDFNIAVRVWTEEPALRRLTEALEVLLPDRRRLLACIHCEHSGIKCIGENRYGVKRYACSACETEFIASEGTPFYAMRTASYPRLFATAVTLWGPWTPFTAWKIAGCSDTKLFGRYVKYIRPLLDELDPAPLVSRPAYRLGFTPGQQGVRCLRCDSTDLGYINRTDPDNPRFGCKSCRYQFYLQASRRHLLPLPDDLLCPGCGGDQLSRKRSAEATDGRGSYRCRDCQRTFILSPRKPQPAKYGVLQQPASTATPNRKGRPPDHPLERAGYDPARLLDALRDRMQLESDAALSRVLGVRSNVICRIRHRQRPIVEDLLVRMHEESGLSLQELRLLMGDRRDEFSTSAAHLVPQGRNKNNAAVGEESAGRS